MRIALVADLHLSDAETTPQEAALDWALKKIEVLAPDACAWLGDITACGAPDAAIRFREKLRGLQCESLIIPGNSDVRTPDTAPVIERYLSTHPKGLKIGAVRLVGIDAAYGRIAPGERVRLERFREDETLIVISHHSPEGFDADSCEFICNWLRTRKVLFWLHGHQHQFHESVLEGVRVIGLRAVDPDKCIDGGPQLCVLSDETGEWSMEEHVFAGGMPDEWTEQERCEFADSLGITCYNVPRDMEFAIRNGVKHLEWRNVDDADLMLLEQWRQGGGRTFSVHMPSLAYSDGVRGADHFCRSALNAVRAQADMITVHPPYVPNKLMQCGEPAFEELADAMADALRPVAEAEILIVVENNHTPAGMGPDPLERQYGCTPMELLGWRHALEERLGRGTCELRLDVGHARNNVPVSQDYPIGRWYSVTGNMVKAYHLHQTILEEDGKMHNHFPITGLHDGLIAFDGFLWAWHAGILNHAPVILEIREGEGAPATWLRLQKILRKDTE